ncbi:hypothetical protein [Erythrobacter alti]|uniref:hypothetical protein n=1 Tax=Erythrobacter alti TaxID=1896145 RepID=UPI0030F419DD
MAEQLTREEIASAAKIHSAPPAYVRNAPVDRTFELPKGLFFATIGLYLGFIAVLGLSFAHPEMIIPVAIFVTIVVAGFGVPSVWLRLAPQIPSQSKTWARFKHDGVMTAYGRTSARDATVQVLILPVLIFIWGVIAAAIAALV